MAWAIERRSKGTPVAAAGALGVLALLAAACGEPRPARDVLVVCVDTLRRDHVGAYGYGRATTPSIDRLAARGTLFELAVSPSNWTVPAVASLLTGVESAEHGAGVVGPVANLDASVPSQPGESTHSIAEVLREAGFATALLSANPYLVGSFGAGFDVARAERVPADQLTDDAVAWWRENADRRRFLYVHYIDVHQPNEPPEPYWGLFGLESGESRPRAARDWLFKSQEHLSDPEFLAFRDHRIGAYDGAIRFVDDHIDRLLEALAAEGTLESTLVVLTSDHGEEFWDHAALGGAWRDDPRGIWGVGHGHTFFEEVTAIPLVLSGPGISRGARVRCRSSLVDLAPTVARAAALVAPSEWRGVALQELDDARCRERALVSSSTAYGPVGGAIYWQQWKLSLRGERRLLYDLAADPGETTDLSVSETSLAEGLARTLEARSAQSGAPGKPMPYEDEALRRQLRELGYL